MPTHGSKRRNPPLPPPEQGLFFFQIFWVGRRSVWPTSRRTRVPRVQLPSVSCCTRSPRERLWSAWTSSCSMNRRGRASEFQPGPADAVLRWCCFSKTTVWCSATGQWDSRDRPRNDSRNNSRQSSPHPTTSSRFMKQNCFLYPHCRSHLGVQGLGNPVAPR